MFRAADGFIEAAVAHHHVGGGAPSHGEEALLHVAAAGQVVRDAGDEWPEHRAEEAGGGGELPNCTSTGACPGA